MAFSKPNLYPKDAKIISRFAFALGHAARVTILEQLAVNGPCSVEQLSKNHPISQPALSYHLKILREAHLVEWREKFPYTYYKLDKKNVTLAEIYLGSFFKKI